MASITKLNDPGFGVDARQPQRAANSPSPYHSLLILHHSCSITYTLQWIASGWARDSLLLFSSGWEFMNMNRVVELGSQVVVGGEWWVVGGEWWLVGGGW